MKQRREFDYERNELLFWLAIGGLVLPGLALVIWGLSR